MSYPVAEELGSDDRVTLVIYPAVGSYAQVYERLSSDSWVNRAVTALVGPANLIGGPTQVWSSILCSETVAAHDPIEERPSPGGIQGWEPDALLRLWVQQSLPDNWDTYGGIAVTEDHARRAWQFLSRVMRPALPLPSFVPLGDGGIQLEWDNGESQISYTTEEGREPEIWLATADEDVQLDEEGFFRALSAFRR